MRSIEEWILAATGHIRFPPDRKAVAEEIRASYEDHRDALLAAGETRDRASFLALQALGDPDETGKLFRTVYHPLLTALWRVSRVILVCLAVVLVLAAVPWMMYQEWSLSSHPEEEILNNMAFYRDRDADTWMQEGYCSEAAKLGEYSFTVTRALLCRAEGWDRPFHHFMVLILKEKGPLMLDAPPDLQYYMTATDDRGNQYDNIWDKTDGYTPERFVKVESIGARRWNSHYSVLWIGNADADVQWIDLAYEHRGKSFSLRVRFDEEISL